MVNVVCELLNRSKLVQHQGPLNIESYVQKWGGGLKHIKKTYPNWDKEIDEACKVTGIGHKIWKQFVNMHDIPHREDFDPINILQHLIQHWYNVGQQNNNYGPYPSHLEQQHYADTCLLPMQRIQAAIVQLQFEPCFKANRMSIEEFLEMERKEKEAKSSVLITVYFSYPCTQ